MTEKESWNDYYKRAQKPPSVDFYRWFLDRVPQHGHVLDVGAGTGRLATVFKKDRPDLTIDALDNQPEAISYLEQNSDVNQVYASSFDKFETPQLYDAIWALNSLFFMQRSLLPDILKMLYGTLKPCGLVMFTYLKDNPETNNYKKLMARTNESTLVQDIKNTGLYLENIKEVISPFGKIQVKLPVFIVTAAKPS